MNDFKPISFKTYFGSRLPQLLHVFSLNAMLKFHKYSKISERDLNKLLPTSSAESSLFARLFFLHQSRKSFN